MLIFCCTEGSRYRRLNIPTVLTLLVGICASKHRRCYACVGHADKGTEEYRILTAVAHQAPRRPTHKAVPHDPSRTISLRKTVNYKRRNKNPARCAPAFGFPGTNPTPNSFAILVSGRQSGQAGRGPKEKESKRENTHTRQLSRCASPSAASHVAVLPRQHQVVVTVVRDDPA